MSSIEERLLLLADTYDAQLYMKNGQFGFFKRGHIPKIMYDTLEEAIAEEAKMIRRMVVQAQEEIKRQESHINVRLTHLGILEVE